MSGGSEPVKLKVKQPVKPAKARAHAPSHIAQVIVSVCYAEGGGHSSG